MCNESCLTTLRRCARSFFPQDKEGKKLHNCHVLLNSDGDVIAEYCKLHLFDVDIPGKLRLKESDYTIPGSTLVPPVATPAGRMALSTVSYFIYMTSDTRQIISTPSLCGHASFFPCQRFPSVL